MVSPEEVNNDGAGWGWTGMEIAQAVPTPGLPAAAGDSTTHWMKQSVGNPSCLLSWAVHPVPVGDIRRAGNRGAGTGCAGRGAELLHRGTITPALGLKPQPGSVLHHWRETSRHHSQLPVLHFKVETANASHQKMPNDVKQTEILTKNPSAWRCKTSPEDGRAGLISTFQRWRL